MLPVQQNTETVRCIGYTTCAFSPGIVRRVVTAKTQYSLKNAKDYFTEHLCVGDFTFFPRKSVSLARGDSAASALHRMVFPGVPRTMIPMRKCRELRKFLHTQRPIEHRHAADPAREADAAGAVDDAADGEGAAALGVFRRVEVVRIPPRVQAQGNEVAVSFGELAVGTFGGPIGAGQTSRGQHHGGLAAGDTGAFELQFLGFGPVEDWFDLQQVRHTGIVRMDAVGDPRRLGACRHHPLSASGAVGRVWGTGAAAGGVLAGGCGLGLGGSHRVSAGTMSSLVGGGSRMAPSYS